MSSIERDAFDHDITPDLTERVLIGLPVCPGVAIGPVFLTAEPPPQITRHRIAAADAPGETARLDAAILQSRRQLAKLRNRLVTLPVESQGEISPLLDAYLQMLGPSRLTRAVRARIQDRLVSAETAVMEEVNLLSSTLERVDASDAAMLKRQADEVREVGRRLVRNLTRAPFRSFSGAAQGSILVVEGLRPSDAALLNPARIAGVATEDGGADGHTGILLRSLGIPTVLGVAGLLSHVRSGNIIVLDGGVGQVTVHPCATSLAGARRALTAFARERQQLSRLRRLEAVTLDGEPIDLQANLELPIELPMIAQSGAEGIGLLRSEFMFMNRSDLPDEEEQAASYRNVVETMEGDPVTIRVLDWGGEKDIEALVNAGYVPEIQDSNPALGLRGIRMLLRCKPLLETQLAGILLASAYGPVRVLLPMVTNASEIRATRLIYNSVANRLRDARRTVPAVLPPLGVMIETPAAALCAHELASDSDFFAIGTNDLCMYTLAVDRGESDVADLYDPLHPAVLRLLQQTLSGAAAHRIPVSACGEMAANPDFVPLLLGLGLRNLSMNASAVPRVKQAVRSVTIDDCQRFAWQALKQPDGEATRRLVASFPRST